MGRLPAVHTARPEEREAAFRLMFGRLADADQDRRVANALHLMSSGELDPAGLFVVRGPSGLRGAIACLPVPGASGLVWPPHAAGARQVETEDALVRGACAWLRERGARIGQSLLVPEETPLAGPLERNGFRHVTTLWCMAHPLGQLPPEPPAPRLDFQNYDPARSQVFHETLLRTYEGTEDCPEVTGVRTIDEIITGHRAQGVYDPGHWWLALAEGRPAGLLLLAESPDTDAWDLAYVGVVPEARRQGVGRRLVLKALHEAKAGAAGQLTLSVDARNVAARQLYEGLGFERFEEREVYLVIWERAGQEG